jgi:phosphotransferase system IIA component
MLATAERDGTTQPLLAALGLDTSMIAGLANRGLVTVTSSRVRAGGKLIEVDRVRIKAAGREALAAEDD